MFIVLNVSFYLDVLFCKKTQPKQHLGWATPNQPGAQVWWDHRMGEYECGMEWIIEPWTSIFTISSFYSWNHRSLMFSYVMNSGCAHQKLSLRRAKSLGSHRFPSHLLFVGNNTGHMYLHWLVYKYTQRKGVYINTHAHVTCTYYVICIACRWNYWLKMVHLK